MTVAVTLRVIPRRLRRPAAAQPDCWAATCIAKGVTMRLTRNVGMLLLAIWLILSGLIPLLHLTFSGLGMVMAILAIAAGVLILVGR